MIILPHLYIVYMITICLAIFTYTDIKSRSINPALIAIMLGFSLIISTIFGYKMNLGQVLVGLLVGGLPYLILAFINKGGKTYALLMGALGFILGFPNILHLIIMVFIIYCLFGIFYFIFSKNRKKIFRFQLPHVPFVMVAWILFAATGMFTE